MDATRTRVESVAEWTAAAAFVALAFAAGLVVLREFRTVTGVTPVMAHEPSASIDVPADIPSRSVSVPMLLLADGKEVRVGETLSAVARRLGSEIERSSQTVARATHGERVTRVYKHAGTQFVLVSEPFERGAEPRVAAIYLQ